MQGKNSPPFEFEYQERGMLDEEGRFVGTAVGP
jgi:hypothetical protein